jgi:hypothetical protein
LSAAGVAVEDNGRHIDKRNKKKDGEA